MLLLAVSPAGAESGDLLIAKALDAAEVMTKAAHSKEYVSLFTSGEELLSLIDGIAAHDYSAPESAVLITIDDKTLQKLLALTGTSDFLDEGIFNLMKDRLFGALQNVFNAQGGTAWLAATSVIAYSNAYVQDDEYSGIAYVILNYGSEQPNVVCSFYMDGKVLRLSSAYVISTAFDGIDLSGATNTLKDAIAEFAPSVDLSGITFTVYSAEELKKL